MPTPEAPTKPAEKSDPEGGTGKEEKPTPLKGKPGKYDLRSQVVAGGAGGGGDGGAEEEKKQDEVHWIVIKLQDDQGASVGTMPNGDGVSFQLKVGENLYTGNLDDKGQARVDGLTTDPVEVSFPGIDASELKGP